MKKLSLSAIAFGICMSIASSLNAQTANDHHRSSKSDKIATVVELSAEQKTKIDDIEKQYKTQISKLKTDESLGKEVKFSKVKALRSQQRDDISKVLTTEQNEKLKAYRKEQRAIGKENFKKESRHHSGFGKFEKELSLTEEQKTKLNEISDKFSAKMKEVRENKTYTDVQKEEMIKTLKKENRQEAKKVLTQEQLQRLQERKKECKK